MDAHLSDNDPFSRFSNQVHMLIELIESSQQPIDEIRRKLVSATKEYLQSVTTPISNLLKRINLDEWELAIFGMIIASSVSHISINHSSSLSAVQPGLPLSQLFKLFPPKIVLQCLRSQAPLRLSGLVEVTSYHDRNFLDDPLVRIPWRVIYSLNDCLDISPAIAPFASLEICEIGLYNLPLPTELRQKAIGIYGEKPGNFVPPISIAVVGKPGSGRTSFVKAIANHIQRPILVLNGLMLSGLEPSQRLTVLREAHLDALWFSAILCITGASSLFTYPEFIGGCLSFFRLGCGHHTAFIIDDVTDIPRDLDKILVVRFRFDPLDINTRLEVWEHSIAENLPISGHIDMELVSAAYDLLPAGVANAMALAVTKVVSNNLPGLDSKNLEESAENQLALGSSKFVHISSPRKKLDSLVTYDDVMEKLRFLVNAAKGKVEVLTKWGFQSILESGKGITALFTGEPGTGKTFCAGLIAGELGRELWRVDLSALVSKFVGETEKHIHELFSATKSKSVVLLLDEADALFGSRVDVKTATDKFANLEIDVLLQEIDAFEGVMILTSNLPENIDQAFRRRLLVHIHFPEPNQSQRELLWKMHIPPEAPIAEDVDFSKLAASFEITGGFIRNAALCAAYTAHERGVITMQDLVNAAIEQTKAAGKLVRFKA